MKGDMKVVLIKFNQFWKTITTDAEHGTVERLLLPSKVVMWLRYYLKGKKE